MKEYRVVRVEVPRHPVVRVTFDDGFAGDLDFVDYIDRGPFFAPLKDESFFNSVTIGDSGRCFGWRLDDIGHEMDFGAEAARADIETALVQERADRFRRRIRSEAAE